jgi:D-arabinose 5-phosphate isomerase GutQ
MISNKNKLLHNVEIVLSEIANSLKKGSYEELDETIDLILRSNIIVTAGAGRMGYAIKDLSHITGEIPRARL